MEHEQAEQFNNFDSHEPINGQKEFKFDSVQSLSLSWRRREMGHQGKNRFFAKRGSENDLNSSSTSSSELHDTILDTRFRYLF